MPGPAAIGVAPLEALANLPESPGLHRQSSVRGRKRRMQCAV